jgi:hypothetical protein
MSKDRQAADMDAARRAATFSVDRVCSLLYSHRDLERRRRIRDVLRDDPVFAKSEQSHQTRAERLRDGFRKVNRILELKQKLHWDVSCSFAFL